jgi:hypothetical protein
MPQRLADHLVARGLLTPDQAASLLEAHRGVGTSFDTHLLEQTSLRESELLRAISEVSGQRAIDLWELQANQAVASFIPPKVADRFGLVPLAGGRESLHIACIYPSPARQLDEISFLLDKRLELWLSLEVRIREWIRAMYGMPLSSRLASVLSRLDSARPASAEKKIASAFIEEVTLEDSLTRDLDGEEPAEWTLEQARASLKRAAKERDQLIAVTLDLARQTFDFAAIFAVQHGAAHLWQCTDGSSQPTAVQAIPIDAASVFRTVCNTRRSYLGPVPSDAQTRNFLQQLGRSPRTIFLFPVEVSGRLVAIFYGDCEKRPMSQRRASDFVLLCQDLPAAFQELIAFRRA